MELTKTVKTWTTREVKNNVKIKSLLAQQVNGKLFSMYSYFSWSVTPVSLPCFMLLLQLQIINISTFLKHLLKQCFGAIYFLTSFKVSNIQKPLKLLLIWRALPRTTSLRAGSSLISYLYSLSSISFHKVKLQSFSDWQDFQDLSSLSISPSFRRYFNHWWATNLEMKRLWPSTWCCMFTKFSDWLSSLLSLHISSVASGSCSVPFTTTPSPTLSSRKTNLTKKIKHINLSSVVTMHSQLLVL